MRARHSAHPLPSFPVYSADFVSQDILALGGGGGATKSGIKNKLRLYSVSNERAIELLDEFQLETGEDAPMSMVADTESKSLFCGINSAMDQLENGNNQNCRSFTVIDQKLALKSTRSTLPPGDLEDFQKITVLSPDRTILAVAGSHSLSVLSPDSLKPLAEPIHADREIYDVTFSKSMLVTATTHNLLVYAFDWVEGKGQSKEKKISLELKRTIEIPDVVKANGQRSFRAARFHPSEGYLYTVINAVSPRTKNSRNSSRQSFICRWNTETWTVDKHRKVGDRGVTCFDISPDGRFLAFGSSDLSIGVLEANTLLPIVTILKAHAFPPTTLKFNPSSTLLVTGSPDNSIRIINVPQYSGGYAWGITLLILLALIIALLAIGLQKYMS
ncbi:WD40 repeat-like protein [Amanita muscaria]